MKQHTIKFANWLNKLDNLSDILTVSLATTIFVIVAVALLGLRRRKFWFFRQTLTKANLIKDQTSKKSIQTHYWYPWDLFLKPTYCNVCESVIVSGVSCIYCNLHSDEKCLKKAEKKFKCKQICMTSSDESVDTSTCGKQYTKPWQHHWIKGNLKLNSVCMFCEEDSGVGPNLNDFKCAWCQRTAHEACLDHVSSRSHDECDFGIFKRLILRPNLISLSKKQLTNITLDDIKLNREMAKQEVALKGDWTPLFVLANPKSGNNDAELIVSHLTNILNPLQIIEISQRNLDMVLKWIEEYSDLIEFKLLVCGGDGSVGWLLESISKFKFKSYEPSVAVLPLGTGNDLSRALNWGQGYLGDVEIEEILTDIDSAKKTKLDRWQVKIEKVNLKKKQDTIQPSPASTKFDLKYMNNYFSIGCDALVTLNFHRDRDQSSFSNRLFNKLIYFKYGTIDTFAKECRTLTEHVQLELDGKKIELPHLESIVVLNIPFWGGGVQPWSLGQASHKSKSEIPEMSINDGYLEVMGIYSSFHIAQLQVGLAEPYRIGQAKHVKITLSKRFPVQIDGEPWEQTPAVINLSFHNKVTMLQNHTPSE